MREEAIQRKITYKDAHRYAIVISRGEDGALDLVHEAWLYHHNLTKGDMFDQPTGYVLRTIKNMRRRRYRAKQHIHKGQLVTPMQFDISEMEITGGITPEKAMISNEFVEEYYRRVDNYKKLTGRPIRPNVLSKLLRSLEEGYKLTEVEKELGINLQKYRSKLQTIATEMREYLNHNPFNANNTVVIKVVKRETYVKNPEKYSDFLYDTDRGADINESFTLLVNENGEGLLIREN